MKNISQIFILFKPLPFEEHAKRRNYGRMVSGRLLTEKGDPGGVVYELGTRKDPSLRKILEKLQED